LRCSTIEKGSYAALAYRAVAHRQPPGKHTADVLGLPHPTTAASSDIYVPQTGDEQATTAATTTTAATVGEADSSSVAAAGETGSVDKTDMHTQAPAFTVTTVDSTDAQGAAVEPAEEL
jgi:hypothetical protein